MFRTRLIFAGIVLVALLLVALPVFAQPPIGVSLTAEPGDWTVGDVIPLTLEIIHPAGYQVINPEFDEAWGDFTVRSVSPSRTAKNTNGSETTRIRMEASLFLPGDFKTPPLDITLTDGDGNLITVEAPSALVSVQSVLIEGDTNLRDIKPQATAPIPFAWQWLAAAGLVLAVAATGFWYFRRSHSENAVDNRLPHEKTLDELQRIEGLNLPQKGRYKEFYTAISDSMRHYLEQVWGIPMSERTTAEIRSACERETLNVMIVDRLLALLEQSDLVKFSKYAPDAESAAALMATARYIVEATKPVAEDEANEGEPSNRAPAKSGRPVKVTA